MKFLLPAWDRELPRRTFLHQKLGTWYFLFIILLLLCNILSLLIRFLLYLVYYCNQKNIGKQFWICWNPRKHQAFSCHSSRGLCGIMLWEILVLRTFSGIEDDLMLTFHPGKDFRLVVQLQRSHCLETISPKWSKGPRVGVAYKGRLPQKVYRDFTSSSIKG